MNNLNPLLLTEWWSKDDQQAADPNIQFTDSQNHPLTDEEVDDEYYGESMAITRKILRKYPTKKSMLAALNKLATGVKGLDNKEKVNKIIESLQNVPDAKYFQWVNENLSGDNHPWIRRLIYLLIGIGVGWLTNNAIQQSTSDLAYNMKHLRIPGTNIGFNYGNIAALGTMGGLGLGKSWRQDDLYQKTPDQILKWNANIDED